MSETSKVKKLYDSLSVNYDLGAYDDFELKMKSRDSRKKLFEAVQETHDLGEFEEFDTKISGEFSESAKPAKTNIEGNLETYRRKDMSVTEVINAPVHPDILHGSSTGVDRIEHEPTGIDIDLLDINIDQQQQNAEIDNSAMAKIGRGARRYYSNVLRTINPVATVKGENRLADFVDIKPEERNRAAINSISEKSKELIEAYRTYEVENVPERIVRGISDYSFSPTDISDNLAVFDAALKFDRGESLRSDENDLLDAYAANSLTQQAVADKLGIAYGAGKMLPDSIELAVEMMATYGLSSAVRKSVQRGLQKLIGTQAKKFAVKSIGTMAGQLAVSPLMPAAYRMASEKLTGVPVGEFTEEDPGVLPQIEYTGREGDVDLSSALTYGVGVNAINTTIERAFGKAIKSGVSAIADPVLKVSPFLQKWTKKFAELNWTGQLKELTERAGVQSFPEEFGEEMLQQLVVSVGVDGEEFKDAFSSDNVLQIAAGVGLMSGMLGGAQLSGMGIKTAHNYRLHKREMNNLNKIFGDRSQVIIDRLDGATTPKSVSDVISSFEADGLLSTTEEVEAIGRYITTSSYLNGVQLSAERAVADELESEMARFDNRLRPDGTIQEVVLMDDVAGTIVNGSVSFHDDGSVDYENTSDNLVFCDENGERRPVLKNSIKVANAPMTLEECRQRSISAISERLDMESEIMQAPTYSEGDVIRYDSGSGIQEAVISGDGGGGRYVVSRNTESGVATSIIEESAIVQEGDLSEEIPMQDFEIDAPVESPEVSIEQSQDDVVELPLDENLNIDFDKISDPAAYREALDREFSAEESAEILTDQIAALGKEIRKRTGVKSSSMNASIAQRKKIKDMKAQIELLSAVLDSYTPVVDVSSAEMPKGFGEWDSQSKIVGHKTKLSTPTGAILNGRWVVVEAGVLTPSHDPVSFKQSSRFPTKGDSTINDNDYSFPEKQSSVRAKAQRYDQRAIDNPVFVKDGIVLSGNNRTMAGQLAAINGTDGLYNEALADKAHEYGINLDELRSMEHPRIVFEVSDDIPINTATFSMFNRSVSESKSPVQQSIAAGKIVTEAGIKRISGIIDGFDSLSQLYADDMATKQIIDILVNGGVIASQEIPQYWNEGITEVGKEFIELIACGVVLDEKLVGLLYRQGMREVRARIVRNIVLLIGNKSLGKFSIIDQLNQAIEYIYNSKKVGGLEYMLKEFDMFNVQQYDDTALDLAVLLDDSSADLRLYLERFNRSAKDAAAGQGGIYGRVTKDDIIELLEQTRNERQQRASTINRRRAGRADSDQQREHRTESEPGGDGSNRYDERVEQSAENKNEGRSRADQGLDSGLSDGSFGDQNKIVTKERAQEIRKRLREKLSQLNAGVDPEVMVLGTELAAYYIEGGMRRFADFARVMVGDFGDVIKPYLRGIYIAAGDVYGLSGMDPIESVSQIDVKQINKEDYVGNIDDLLEGYTGEEREQNVDRAVEDGRRSMGRLVGENMGRSGVEGVAESVGVDPVVSAVSAEQGVDETEHTKRHIQDDTNSLFDQRSGFNRVGRMEANGLGERRIGDVGKQVVERSVLDEIVGLMPFLDAGQVSDVCKAESRFEQGKGILFTNGTGTGKTFTALGIIKRFFESGRGDSLIVVPNREIIGQWTKAGKSFFNLDVTPLSDTKDSGRGISITTYANFRQNEALGVRSFGLIVYDESHYLGQSESGGVTAALRRHREVSISVGEARKRACRSIIGYDRPIVSKDMSLDEHEAAVIRMNAYDSIERENRKLIEDLARELYDGRPNVVFLSATPFAYHKSIRYVDGSLFNVEESFEGLNRGMSYNEASGWDRFFVENLGYRMRYNKLTVPENQSYTGILEQRLHDRLVREGVVSGRAIDVPYDYSRQFISLHSNIGQKIDAGISKIREVKELRPLENVLNKRWNFVKRSQFLEAVKSGAIVDHIRRLIESGRKVVVYHNFIRENKDNPLRFTPVDGTNVIAPPESLYVELDSLRAKFDSENGGMSEIEIDRMVEIEDIISAYESFLVVKDNIDNYNRAVELWNSDYREFADIEFDGIASPINTFIREFSDQAGYFNGTIPPKKRSEVVSDFNSDTGTLKILLVQRQAGKEGISFHDVTGKYQRVLINLGLPTAPTDAIQIEGRIYRIGLKSDAAFEYPIIDTNFERVAFAQKIAMRSKTAENLALGSKARRLEGAFKNGYINAIAVDVVDLNSIGKGDKDVDCIENSISPYEESIALYFSNQKNVKSKEQREGVDYFATPEPIGFKMIEFLDCNESDVLLEPSAGHGAISRFFPVENKSVAIEPSSDLYSKLSINSNGQTNLIQGRFEDYYVGNKFNCIAMNPPFGYSGKTAMEHVEKAFSHLRNNGRIVAIVPAGNSMDKRIDQFMQSVVGVSLVADIYLPGVAFERAGTSVSTRIVVIDKSDNSSYVNRIDLRYLDSVKSLFEAMENIAIPRRVNNISSENNVSLGEVEKSSNIEKVERDVRLDVEDYTNTKTNELMKRVQVKERLSDVEYKRIAGLAKKQGGYWSLFAKGFLFSNDLSAQRFAADVSDSGVRFRKESDAGVHRVELSAKRKMEIVGEVGRALNTSVTVVDRVDDLPDHIKSQIRDTDVVSGVFDAKSDSVYVVSDGITSERDLRSTLLHEIVGHKGIRGLFGDRADEFSNRVFDEFMPVDVRGNYVQMYGTKQLAAEEYLAELAEGGVSNPGILRKAIAYVRNLLREMGIDLKLSDTDIQYVLYAASNYLKEGMSKLEADHVVLSQELFLKSISKQEPDIAKIERLAPNGVVSHLTQDLWEMVRSDPFKNWFGDWEKVGRIEKLRNSPSVEISGDEIFIDQDIKQYRKNAKAYGLSLRGEYINLDTGKKIQLSRGSIEEVITHSIVENGHLQSIAAIPGIIENSIYIDTIKNEDVDKKPDVTSYDYYVCGLKIGSVDYTVKAVVATSKSGERYYDHKLTQIEKGKLIPDAHVIDHWQELNPLSNSEVSTDPVIHKSGEDTSIEHKDKRLISILQINGSKVVDENGEPAVVYHGSHTGGFEVFDPLRSNKGKLFGPGIYTTDVLSVAEGYANRKGAINPAVYGLFVNVKNPLDMDAAADIDLWNDVLAEMDIDADLSKVKTNEEAYREVCDFFQAGGFSGWEAEESLVCMIENLGCDGITHIGGGRFDKNAEVKHRVYIALYPEQVKSVSNNGDFSFENANIYFRKTSATPDQMIREIDEPVVLPDSPLGADAFSYARDYSIRKKLEDRIKMDGSYRISSAWNNFVSAGFDTVKYLEIIVDKIRERHGEIPGALNPYYTYFGMSGKRNNLNVKAERMLYDLYRELGVFAKELADNGRAKDGQSEVTRYLQAKTGLERNKVKRSEIEASAGSVMAEAEVLNERLATLSGMDEKPTDEIKTLEYQRDRLIGQAEKLLAGMRSDYGGVTELQREIILSVIRDKQGIEMVGKMNLDQMRDYATSNHISTVENFVEQTENRYDVNKLWGMINGVSHFNIDNQVKFGLLSKESGEFLKSRYSYYLPLKGNEIETSRESFDYLDKWRSGSAKIHTASGHDWHSVDPIVQLSQDTRSTISASVGNGYMASVLRMASSYDMPKVYCVNRVYYLRSYSSDGEIEWSATLDRPGEELFKSGDAVVKLGKLGISASIRGVDLKKHQMTAYNNGELFVVSFVDPVVAERVSLRRDSRIEINRMESMLKSVTRFMAKAVTSFSPAFVLSNLRRDVLYASLNAGVKEGAIYQAKIVSNMARVQPAMTRYYTGRPNLNNPLDRMIIKYFENGGESGIVTSLSFNEDQRRLDKMIRMFGDKKFDSKKMLGRVGEFVSEVNSYIENVSRISAFVTSMESGRSVNESIFDSKEITTNFQRHGDSEFVKHVPTLYMFFNAALQGLNTEARLAKRHPVKFTLQRVCVLLAGMAWAMRYNVDDKDDEIAQLYWDNSAYARNSGVLIQGMDGVGIPVQLPHELRLYWGLGQMVSRSMMSTQVNESLVMDFVELLNSAINPTGTDMRMMRDGNFSIAGVLPAMVTPFVEAYVDNANFLGIPVAKTTQYNRHLPESERIYDARTWKWLAHTSRFLSESTREEDELRGDIEVNPQKIQHVLRGYGGGMMLFSEELGNFLYKTASGQELEIADIPFSKLFYRENAERNYGKGINNRYFYVMDRVKMYDATTREFKKRGDVDGFLRRQNSSKNIVFKQIKSIEKQIQKSVDFVKVLEDRKANAMAYELIELEKEIGTIGKRVENNKKEIIGLYELGIK